MNALVACEESQRVTIELRRLGVEAYSCDIQECSGGHPEWHIMGDVLPILRGGQEIRTMDGWTHIIPGKWDLIIAHPPCTDLAVSGARWFREKQIDFRQQKACVFFMRCALAECDHIAVENPVGVMSKCYEKPTQIIQPYQFGDPQRKTTCLWLKGLPPLKPTDIVEPNLISYTCKNGKKVTFSECMVRGLGNERAKRRSETFPGIAKAMAEQWTEYIRNGDEQITMEV